MLSITLSTLILCADPTATTETRPKGVRTKLAIGELFVPEGLRAADGPIDLLVHLHGSAELMERNLANHRERTVLVTVSLNGLSAVYRRQFTIPESFLSLCREAEQKAASLVGADQLAFRRISVSSFSAGFGGVRELLKSPACYRRIDAIVMADSIYAGYLGEAKERGIDPGLMEGFLRFARDAIEGDKQFVVSHCELQPEGYASTKETADYLIHELKLQRDTCQEMWADQWSCHSRCERSGLHIFGFAGTTGADHMRHLRNIGHLWQIVSK